jgi:hypothetical protein
MVVAAIPMITNRPADNECVRCHRVIELDTLGIWRHISTDSTVCHNGSVI